MKRLSDYLPNGRSQAARNNESSRLALHGKKTGDGPGRATEKKKKKRIHYPQINTNVEKELYYEDNPKGYYSEQNPTKVNKYSVEYSYDTRSTEERKAARKKLRRK